MTTCSSEEDHDTNLPRAHAGAKRAGMTADLARARELVLAHGWNATAYQILNPGIAHWFSPAGDAVVGFVEHAGTRVVAGAPVCTSARLQAVVHEFGAATRQARRHVCYFGAGERLERLLAPIGSWSAASLGAQPSWDPARWPAIIQRRASLRAQLHRARNKSVQVAEWTEVHQDDRARLRTCLAEWLDRRGLPPLHFLVEPETLGNLHDRHLYVATRGDQVVGFLVASPVPARRGWLIEQIIRGRAAPNGTAELLVDAAMRALAAEGADYVTLGLAPLSRHARLDDRRMPLWLRLALRWVRAHARRFYDFEGLDRFKTKFEPEQWEEIVALADAPRFPPRALWAIASAFSEGSPVALLARALARAARQEVRWITKRGMRALHRTSSGA
jgi:phosphatidylglycerol lysyltransferase